MLFSIARHIRTENVLKVVGVNARACVGNKELYICAVVDESVTIGNTAFHRMLQRITNQVREHLCHTVGIGIECYLHIRLVPNELQRIRATELEDVLQAMAEIVQVGHSFLDADFTGLYARQVKDVVDERQQTPVVTLHDFHIFHTVFWRVRFRHHARKALDGIQGSTYLVTHICEEKRLHAASLLCLLRFFFVFVQFFVCGF